MNAKLIESAPPGGDRIPLKDLVPLKTPLLVQFFPIYACNFKCKYCTFSIPKQQRGFISNKTLMEFSLFEKCIDDLKKFNQKIKVIRFVGMGEPLLHKQLPEMIKLTSESNLAERIEILTNASLLTKDISDKLIGSGLTKLLISIQGTSSQKYKEISNVDISFNEFIKNIKYFYEKKQNEKVHIKIIDCALDNDNDAKIFFNTFGNICDSIGIENSGPIFPGVDFNNEIKYKLKNKTQFGVDYFNFDICPQSFFSMQINPDGNVVPCYSIEYPKIVGNCVNESLFDIWNGKKLNDFRIKMLNGINNTCITCSKCEIIKHRMFKNDDISEKKLSLQKFYSEQLINSQ